MKVLSALTLGLLLSTPAAALEVLTSVKPLQLIATAITDGAATTELLLKPGTSPHDYALRPSDLKRVKQADLVVWVGPELEQFLTPLLSKRTNTLQVLAQLPVDHAPEGHEGHTEHAEHKEHHHQAAVTDEHAGEHDAHQHGNRDPHVWLDPHNAQRIAELLAERLSQLDPGNATRYRSNLQQFKTTLAQVDREIMQQLAPVRNRGYFVFHDAYGYWEDHYRIPSLGHFTINPERSPGAQTVSRIHQALSEAKAQCVFAEPQFRPAVLEAVVRNTAARVGILDPLAADIPVDNQGYFNFLRQLADNMVDCLTTR